MPTGNSTVRPFPSSLKYVCLPSKQLVCSHPRGRASSLQRQISNLADVAGFHRSKTISRHNWAGAHPGFLEPDVLLVAFPSGLQFIWATGQGSVKYLRRDTPLDEEGPEPHCYVSQKFSLAGLSNPFSSRRFVGDNAIECFSTLVECAPPSVPP